MPVSSSILTNILAQLQSLPPDASEWQDIPAFVASIQSLVERKFAERDQGRIQLRQALAALERDASAPLGWWTFDISAWSAEHCPWDRATALAQRVREWQAMLLRHDELRQTPASSRAEEQARRNGMAGLETNIDRGYSELSLALSPEPLLPVTPSDDAAVAPLPSKPGADEDDLTHEIASVVASVALELAGFADIQDQQIAITEQEPSLVAAPELAADEADQSATGVLDAHEPADEALDTSNSVGDIAFQPVAEDEATWTAIIKDLDIYMPPGEPVLDEEQLDQEEATLGPLIPSPTRGFRSVSLADELPLSDVEDDLAMLMPSTPPEDDTDEAWSSLLFAMMAEDDLAGAYWLAKSLGAMSRPTPVPDWLLAAVQASRWVWEDTPGLERDLLEISSGFHVNEDSSAHALLALAAAVRSALIAPFSGMSAWLSTPSVCPPLRDIVIPIQAFTDLNVGIHREDIVGVAVEEQRNAAIAAISREAYIWLEEAPIRRKRVGSVWRSLVGPHGALREFLLPVCENQREKFESVRAELETWQDRPTVYALINEINLAGNPGHPEPVFGAGLQDLYRDVERAAELAERWCNAVERAQSINAQGDWFRDQVIALWESVEQALPSVDTALNELIQDTQPPLLAASACVLRTSLRQLRELLDLPIANDQPVVTSLPWRSLSADPDSLDAMLAARLLWLPEVPLADSGLPLESSLDLIAPVLRAANRDHRTLESAADQWLARQDYRFMDRLMTGLAEEGFLGDFQQRFDEALGASRATLRASIAKTRNWIEQALLDEAISDEQRASYGASFETLFVEEVRNFKTKLADLDQIRIALQQGYQVRLKYLREQHALIANRLKASHIPSELQSKALEFVDSALQRNDVRVAIESLARLQEVLDTGGELRDDWYAPASDRDCLEEFNVASQRIERWLDQPRADLRMLAAAARDGIKAAGVQFGSLTEPHRKEAGEALLAWRALKQNTAKNNNAPLIAVLLRYLGFDLQTGDATSIDFANVGVDWSHARVSMAAGDLARPIPEFGSQAQDHYDVICLWERHGADTIAARLRNLHLDIHTVIVLYLGRISARQKRDVVRVSRDQELAIAVLDEALLIFLAQERNVRLPAFLRCALPFSALNPYRPFQAGDVPPEMFFGREPMARELLRQGGSCLVYGGRQLGKSALLRHVERQFHFPEREQYAWVENMKVVFDPQAGKTSINVWRSLREGFKAHKLLESRISTDKPEEIARYIRETMQAKPRQRVTVMLDEADEFLDTDAKDGFRAVIALRDLMVNTGQRFKVIFAGLQSVQRFQGMPNQPLAHFGTPLCVGPLEPGEAQQLVRQPLEALGYRFADDGAVLRILSYTNYHPGLIQYFCQELLKQLRDRSSTALPPYLVRQEDIETLYRTQQVRDRIRERFEWTLALDMHYQAIAWTLIEDQIKDRDSYSRAYPPSDVLQLVRGWWPAGFSNTGSDQLRGWLDELCGLGVLVRNNYGHYRLRSPNMVCLLGKETDIIDGLLELTTKSPTPAMEADSHHAPLDEKAARYSPLTYAEERNLALPRFGVGLVFASDAVGAGQLPAAIRRFLPADLPSGAGDCTPIPSAVTEKNLEEWLREYLKTQTKTERMIVYQQVSSATRKALADSVDLAQRFCQRHQAKERWLRVLFLFDHQATWRWLDLPETERLKLEETSDAALWPRPWTLSAVRRRLAQHEKLDDNNAAASQEVLRVTGGWPYLLDVLFNLCGKETDLRPTLRGIDQELSTSSSQLSHDFHSRLGITQNEIAQRVLDFVINEGHGRVEEEYLSPDFIGGRPELTAQQCIQAKEFLQRLGLVRLSNQILTVDPIITKVLTPA